MIALYRPGYILLASKKFNINKTRGFKHRPIHFPGNGYDLFC